MNREQALKYGVKPELYKDFQEEYNTEMNKRAREMAVKSEGGAAAPALAKLREAIGSMLRLIDDPARLRLILNNINRHYAQYVQESGEKGGAECP